MTEAEREEIKRLSRCVMLPGSRDKKFVRSLCNRTESYEITDRQREMIETLKHKYRRQLADPRPARFVPAASTE